MEEEYFYFTEDSIKFSGDANQEEVIETSITNLETILELERGTEIVFKNGKMSAIYEYFVENNELFKKLRQIEENEKHYKKPNYKIKSILRFNENINGYHQLGGDFSNEFNEPLADLAVPFQYLGFINNLDPNFSWLPYKLHLTYPIYLGAEIVYLDYSDHRNPKIVNNEELEKYSSVLSEVNKESKINFKRQNFDLKESSDYSLEVNSGIPNWIQGHYIPKCPLTGNKMKFVCQIYRGSKMENSNIIPENDWNKNYFEKMDFFGQDLYIFFEPKSNIACLLTQGT